ncbi:VOC family protein [Pseudonocardia halophobica]|uniref:VOC family protein n=1 Tax=Pseudonocardia halophobica TaxID=29401 RepID=UPI003D9378D2
MGAVNTEFRLGGINHLALVCSDMARTIDFYSGVLGMPLIKTIELPGGASTSSSTAAAATAWPSSGSPTRPTACPASPHRPSSRARATWRARPAR